MSPFPQAQFGTRTGRLVSKDFDNTAIVWIFKAPTIARCSESCLQTTMSSKDPASDTKKLLSPVLIMTELHVIDIFREDFGTLLLTLSDMEESLCESLSFFPAPISPFLFGIVDHLTKVLTGISQATVPCRRGLDKHHEDDDNHHPGVCFNVGVPLVLVQV